MSDNNTCPTRPAGDDSNAQASTAFVQTASVIPSKRVASIAALRTYAPTADNWVEVLGYYIAGDGGGGLFYGSTSGPFTDNGGTIITQNAGTANSAWLRPASNIVSVVQFGGQPDGTDATSFMNAAAAYLNSIGGGILQIPLLGNWRMNWSLLYPNIIVQGVGGKADSDTYAIHPYSIASAPITMGNGTVEVRGSMLVNLSLSGSDGTASGVRQAAHNAPYCLYIIGNVINCSILGCVLYNGVHTLHMEPTNSNPVTGLRFDDITLRNDINDSSSVVGVYEIHYPGNAYATDNTFNQFKLNMSGNVGFAAVLTDVVFGITNSYWDIQDGHGVNFVNASYAVGLNWILDPGTNNAVVVQWATTDTDPSRFLNGYIQVGSQLYKNSGGTTAFPNDANSFSYEQRLGRPYLDSIVYLTNVGFEYSQTVYIGRTGALDTSPVIVQGANFAVGQDFVIYGGNGSASGQVSAASINGGLRFDASGTNQNILLYPTGTGLIVTGGSGVAPTSDNTTSLGQSSARYLNGYISQLRPGTGAPIWTSGSGSPNGAVTAPVGSLYTDTGGGANTTLYVKESGTGNTGWTAK